jgi:hypothetical protein
MEQKTEPVSDFIAARAELRSLGINLDIAGGAYCLNYDHGSEGTARYADDLGDACALGRDMAANKPTRLPPLGPTGRRNTRRARMYRHNTRLAAIRRRGGGGQ